MVLKFLLLLLFFSGLESVQEIRNGQSAFKILHEAPEPTGEAVKVLADDEWKAHLFERVNKMIKILENRRGEVKTTQIRAPELNKDYKQFFNLGSLKETMADLKGRSIEEAIKADMTKDLWLLQNILDENNKSKLKSREETLGEICDRWSSRGFIKVIFEHYIGTEDGPLCHLSFCFPADDDFDMQMLKIDLQDDKEDHVVKIEPPKRRERGPQFNKANMKTYGD